MAETQLAQRYDLTNVISKHLDRHMVFPLLEFLTDKKMVILFFLTFFF